MRGKRYIGRTLAGMMAAVLMLTSVPFTVYAAETGTSAETVSEQDENLSEEETAQEDEVKDKSEEESEENGENSESDEEQTDEGNGEEDQEAEEKDDENSDNGEAEVNPDADDMKEEPGDQDITEETVSENSVEEKEEVLRTDLQSSLSVKGRNSVGNMLAEALSDKAEEQLESNGYNVFSVEMEGQIAEVSFETQEDAVLTVAIYDESGKRLITSASCEVSTGDQMTELEFTEAVPEYFYVRSFLTDTKTLQPLCSLYDSPMYTEEMQKFLEMTTDDFDEDRVLNLDDDKTNNFAVYNEDAIVIPDKDGVNILVSADEENYIYVIENADESITSLEPGDLFVYEYADDDLLIVKIATIEVDGTTATIMGEKLSMEEVFDYVKIDTEADLQEAEIDASGLEEGVVYEGLVSYSDGDVETYAVDVGGKGSVATSIKFVDKKLGDGVKLSGGLDFNLEVSTKVYLSFKYQYLELKFDYSVKLQGSLSAERTGEDAFKIPLPYIGFNPVPCVGVILNPCFVLEAKGKVSWNGTLKGTIGVSVSSDEGVKNLTSSPQYKSEIKAEISVFLGISLEPEVEIISEKIAEASLEAAVGAEVKGTMVYKEPSFSKVHGCVHCIDGDINGKIKVNFKAKLFNKDKLTFKSGIEKTFHLNDFYYSLDFDEFGWGKCPHYLYKIAVTVTDKNGRGVKEAKITTSMGFHVQKDGGKGQTITDVAEAVQADAIMTDEKGMAIGYLPSGKYSLLIEKEKYGTTNKKIQVDDREKSFGVRFATDGGKKKRLALGAHNGGIITANDELYVWNSYVFESGNDAPIKALDNIASLALSRCPNDIIVIGYDLYGGAVTTNGDLYMWGDNPCGQLGNGTTSLYTTAPVKVLDKVETVSLGGRHSAAITKDGSLYMWGENWCGKLGDGTTTDRHSPVKILENVKAVSLGQNHSGAITKDGGLYMWGNNYSGQLGDGTTTDRYSPVKVLDDVEKLSLGAFHSGAITKDGSLYMWGNNESGQLGDGTTTNRYKPTKILSNAEDVCLGGGGSHSGAITRDGSLYMWGDNWYGQIGDGTTINRHKPVKILDNVAEVSLGDYHSGAITRNGNLYMWGWNLGGSFGDGSNKDEKVSTPVRISLPKSIQSILSNDSVQIEMPVEKLDVEEQDSFRSFSTGTTIIPVNFTAQATGTTGNVRFYDLVPEETYNFYVVESREKDNPLEASNLLYIDQYQADSSGNLAVTYEAKRQSETAVSFVVGMSKMNLADAEVSVPDLISNGSTQYAMPKVIYKDTLLSEGVDYEVTDNVGGSAPGTYSVTLTGIGLYAGEVTMGYRIVENPYIEDGTEADTLRTPTASVLSGTEVDAGTKVRLLTETAGAKIYYTLDGTFPTKESTLYTSPIMISQDTTITAYVVKESYIDSPTVTFRYTVKDISGNGDVLTEDIPSDGVIPDGLWMSDITAQNYTGKAIKPVVRVYDHKTLLTEKKDYTITYKNNVKANDASVAKTAPVITVTGKGNYTGKETQTFVILPKDLSDEDVLVDAITVKATGKIQNPIPKVTWHGKSLAKNRDFKVSYPSRNGEIPYQTAGTYEIQIEGSGNFTGQRKIAFTITESKLVSKLTVGKIANQTYTGEAINPALTVKDGKNILKEGEDYSVAYVNNVAIGTATAEISGMGNYTGTRKVTYKITAVASINKAKANISFKNPAMYTGQGVKPDEYTLTITLKDAQKKNVSLQLQEGIDYAVSYQNNNKAGTATIIFTGINGYNGSLKKTYKIAPYDIKADAEKVAWADKKIVVRLQDYYAYAKGGCKPEPTVTFQGKVLKKGTDYTLSYKNNTILNDGDDPKKLPTVIVKGKGNFKGSCSGTYLIEKQELGELTLTVKDKVWQNKKNIYKSTITITDVDGKKLSAGKDYDKNVTYVYDSETILEDGSIRKAGTAVSAQDIIPADTVIKVSVNAVEKGNYKGKRSATYRITQSDISKASVKIPTQTYTGKPIEPDEEIEVTLNRTLLSLDNYEIVGYTNNVNKGNASVTICGKNDCGGTKTVKFKIRSKGFIWWRK